MPVRRRAPKRPPGPAIDGYTDFELIGAGGFSKVYTARQEDFARTVAVKIITVDLDDAARRRFARERALTGQLDGHPHIVRVYDTGETDTGEPYLAMEHHAQGSLADRIRRHGPLPLAEVLRGGVQLAGALEAAHTRGIVHRDVKPQNVLVSSFVGPVLADFGIAAVDDVRLHTIGHEAFSVLHAAPEVLAGEPATARSDLYSLASTLYELLAGRAPFADDDRPALLALLNRVLNDPLPPIGRTDIPDAVEQGLAALLARDPAARPADAAAFAERLQALEALAGGHPTPRLTALRPGGDGGSAGGGGDVGQVGLDAGRSPWARPAEADIATPREREATPAAPAHPAPDTLKLARAPRRAAPPVPAAASVPVPQDPDPVGAARAGAGPTNTVALNRPRPAPSVPPSSPSPTGPPGRLRQRLILGAIGGVIGLGVAIAVSLTIRSPDREVTPDPVTTIAPTGGPATPAALPACLPARPGEVPPVPFSRGRPPTDLAVDVHPDGRSATVRWGDPNAGANVYVVFQRCDAGGGRRVAAVRTIGAGQPPAATVDGLRLDVNYCFGVGVLEPTGGSVLFTDPTDQSQFRCLDGTRP